MDVREETLDGKDGFVMDYEVMAVSEFTAEEKAIAAATSRFPLKVTQIEVVSSRMPAGGAVKEFVIGVWVPTKGLKESSAVSKTRDLVGMF